MAHLKRILVLTVTVLLIAAAGNAAFFTVGSLSYLPVGTSLKDASNNSVVLAHLIAVSDGTQVTPVGPGTPVPVAIISGGSAANSATYSAAPAAAPVGTSSTALVSAGAYTKTLTLVSSPTSAGNVWLNVSGGTAVVGQGLFIPAGGGTVTFGGVLPMPTGAINGISDSGTVSVSIQGA